uniref:Uncharacterized protein n=1 Tax=Rhizophora mucronata TaxID=61149 RepID=A0A2P2NAN9_RHIMU
MLMVCRLKCLSAYFCQLSFWSNLFEEIFICILVDF